MADETFRLIPACPNNSRLAGYDAFLSRYLPRDRTMYDHHLQTWMEILASSQGKGLFSQLEVATDALSTIVMGRSQQQSAIIVSGMELYGKALAGLRCNPVTKTNWLGAIMTSVVLQIYEVFYNFILLCSLTRLLTLLSDCRRFSIRWQWLDAPCCRYMLDSRQCGTGGCPGGPRS